jgi:hypothetical protein
MGGGKGARSSASAPGQKRASPVAASVAPLCSVRRKIKKGSTERRDISEMVEIVN